MHRLLPTILFALAAVAAPQDLARKPDTDIRIALVGDSTQTATLGYGRGFCANFTPQVDCLNLSREQVSTGSFRDQGLWTRALAAKPDYLVIEFGHGAQEQGALPEPSVYEVNLRTFVTEARAAEIKPILVTPLAPRIFGVDGKIHSDLTPQAAAVRRVAQDLRVPLIDLQAESIALMNQVGETNASKLAATKGNLGSENSHDKASLNWAGSYVFGRIVVRDLSEEIPELARYVSREAAKLPPEGLKAMKVLEGSDVQVVLIGNSAVAAPVGWGDSFCRTLDPKIVCHNDALHAHSVQSFVAEGAWKSALARHGDYYLIQFRHGDPGHGATAHAEAADFATYLRLFISGIRSIGAVPIFVFAEDEEQALGNSEATSTSRVAKEQGVPVIVVSGHNREDEAHQIAAALLRAQPELSSDILPEVASHP